MKSCELHFNRYDHNSSRTIATIYYLYKHIRIKFSDNNSIDYNSILRILDSNTLVLSTSFKFTFLLPYYSRIHIYIIKEKIIVRVYYNWQIRVTQEHIVSRNVVLYKSRSAARAKWSPLRLLRRNPGMLLRSLFGCSGVVNLFLRVKWGLLLVKFQKGVWDWT